MELKLKVGDKFMATHARTLVSTIIEIKESVVFLEEKCEDASCNHGFISYTLPIHQLKMRIHAGTFINITFETVCSHEYKQYVGFTDTYEYCTKCDLRK